MFKHLIDLKKHQVCYQAILSQWWFCILCISKQLNQKNITYKLYILTFQDAKELPRCN